MRTTTGVRTRSLSCRRAGWLAGCVWITLTIPVLAQCPSGGGTAGAASTGTGTTTNAAPAAFGATPVIQLQLALQGTPQPS